MFSASQIFKNIFRTTNRRRSVRRRSASVPFAVERMESRMLLSAATVGGVAGTVVQLTDASPEAPDNVAILGQANGVSASPEAPDNVAILGQANGVSASPEAPDNVAILGQANGVSALVAQEGEALMNTGLADH